MPIVNPIVSRPILIDCLDIIEAASMELIWDSDTITTWYPLVLKSLDITSLYGLNEIHILTGYETISVSSTLSTTNESTIPIGYLIVQ